MKTSAKPVSKSGQRSKSQRESLYVVIDKLLVRGIPASDIALQIAKEHGITERQAWRDLAAVYKRWEEAGERDKKQASLALGQALRRRDFLYQQSVQEGEFHTALEVEKDIAKLRALYPTERAAVVPGATTNVNVVIAGRLAEATEVYRAVAAGLRGLQYDPQANDLGESIYPPGTPPAPETNGIPGLSG